MATLNALQLKLQLGFNDSQMRAVTQSIEQWLRSGETYPRFAWDATIHSHVHDCYRQMFDGSEEAIILERTEEATRAIRTALNALKVDHSEQWIRDVLPPSHAGPQDQKPSTRNWFNGWFVLLLLIAATVLYYAISGSDNDNNQPPLSTCPPLTPQDQRLRHTLVHDLEAGMTLIPRLANEIALTLRLKKGQELMSAAYVLTNQTARTSDSFQPFVECVQDLSGGNWWTRDEEMTTPDPTPYKETYTTKASLIRRPQSALSLNLELLESRTLVFSKLVLSVTPPLTLAAKEEAHRAGRHAGEKLLNVLHHHQHAAQRGLYHVRQTNSHVAEGLAIVSSASFSTRKQEDLSSADATSPELTALHAAMAATRGQLRSWAVDRHQRDQTLFSGDEAQWLWNSQGPMKSSPLEESE